MKAATVNELRKEIKAADPDVLQEICLRLIKYKKENKELATYLLFEAHDEESYRQALKDETTELFDTIPQNVNAYYIKKSLRKVLRFVNRQVKYSGNEITELEARVFFCLKIKERKIPRVPGTVLGNLYDQQLKKINSLMKKLQEDLQADYEREVKEVNKR